MYVRIRTHPEFFQFSTQSNHHWNHTPNCGCSQILAARYAYVRSELRFKIFRGMRMRKLLKTTAYIFNLLGTMPGAHTQFGPEATTPC